jgi:hypothetical protein
LGITSFNEARVRSKGFALVGKFFILFEQGVAFTHSDLRYLLIKFPLGNGKITPFCCKLLCDGLPILTSLRPLFGRPFKEESHIRIHRFWW